MDLVGGPPQGQQPARLTPWRRLQRVHLFWGTEYFSRCFTKNPIVVPKNCFFWLTFSSGETQCLSVAPFFLLKWLQSKTSFILSDFFYGRHCRAVFHANFSCGCAANLLQVCGTTGMLCFNLDCPAVVVWLPGLKLSSFVNYTCVAGSFSEEM